MKNTKLLVLIGSLFISSQAFAATTTCTKGKLERRVEVTPIDSATQTPCEVKYFKDAATEGKVLWSAKNKADYCEEKAAEFVQKLGTDGWNCSGAQASAAPKTETKVETPKTDTKAPAEKTAPAAAVKK